MYFSYKLILTCILQDFFFPWTQDYLTAYYLKIISNKQHNFNCKSNIKATYNIAR